MADAPFFIRGDGVDALAEYLVFLEAVRDPASHLLAEFVDIQANGSLSDIPEADNAATHVRGLYCRRLEGWAVFYVPDDEWTPVRPRCRIWIVLVGSLNPHSFSALESEAETRLREYESRLRESDG